MFWKNRFHFLAVIILLSLMRLCQVTVGTETCNCGQDWNEQQCGIQFDRDPFGEPKSRVCGLATQHVSGAIPSAARDVTANYYIDNNVLGLNVLFNAPQENAGLVRYFDVTVTGMDYPTGYQECFRVKLSDSVVLSPNNSFYLHCLHSRDLVPRQRFQISVQPSPYDSQMSNRVPIMFQMPGCRTVGGSLTSVCDNFDDPYEWAPSYAPLCEVLNNDRCKKSCVKITFDTYEWSEYNPISIYRISICTGERGNKCIHSRLVDCNETVRQHIPFCSVIFEDLEPDTYTVFQNIDHDFGGGHVEIGGVRKKAVFIIEDQGTPKLDNPRDITKYVNSSDDVVPVFWTPPSIENYVESMVTFTCTHDPGDNFTVGDTRVTCTVIDYQGREDQESFVVSIKVYAPPTKAPPKDAESSNHNKPADKQEIIWAIVGGACAGVILIAILLVLKLKKVFKKKSDSNADAGSCDSRRTPTPTESTDTTPYPRGSDKENLVANTQEIDGSSQYPCCDEDEFNNVRDKFTLNGLEFGGEPNPHHPRYRPPPATNVTVNIMPSPQQSFQPGETPTWIATCVENESDSSKYKRLESYDSGINNDEFPTLDDLTSVSQIEVHEEV